MDSIYFTKLITSSMNSDNILHISSELFFNSLSFSTDHYICHTDFWKFLPQLLYEVYKFNTWSLNYK